jgi:transcription-repair coupling factor (superfamily II helicase)
VAADLRRLVPQARIAVGHGQMPEGQLEKVMMDFYEGEQDILVCTTIIESGLDIPNANTIMINNAQNFGLAQLYQLRGRVGRSAQQGYCYLLYSPTRKLSDEAERRLETIRDFTQLGAGFQVALRDLEIRGAGDILGAEQSGHVAAVGFDLYCKMLNETVQELRGEKPAEAEFSTVLEIPVPAGLPDAFVGDPRQKVTLYKKIAQVRSAEQLTEVRAELRDRYGPLPDEAENLLRLAEVKLRALDLLIPAIRVRDGQMWVVLPFYPEITASQRDKLQQATGWPSRYEQKSLLFEGLFGRAAGSKQYPPPAEFLSRIVDLLDRLRRWRDGK